MHKLEVWAWQLPVAIRAGLSCRYFHVALCMGVHLDSLI